MTDVAEQDRLQKGLGLFPLSFGQERLWFLHRLAPASPVYHVPFVFRLRGDLRLDALQIALDGLVARHESLRTCFADVDGEPLQSVLEPSRFKLPIVELDAGTEDERERMLRRLVLHELDRPFDLEHSPAVRGLIARVSGDDHVLVLTVHHVVTDAWSMNLLRRELGELYAIAVRGSTASLPELSIQYADFAAWQREMMDDERLEEELGYWRQVLGGAPEVLTLPTDRPRTGTRAGRGGHVRVVMPQSVATGLRGLCREEDATLFMGVLAALTALLSRYAGQDDVVVGTPVSTRSRVELESIIGLFTNTLPLRVQLDGEPTFRELVRRVREVTLDALGHQDVPFERIVSDLNPDRALDHEPLFQVLFTYGGGEGGELVLPGVTAERIEVARGTAKFDLAFFAREHDGGLRIGAEYDSDLFDEFTIERMLEHLQLLIERALEHDDLPVARLPLMTSAEESRLTGWAAGVRSDQRVVRVEQFVEDQVRRTPAATAVVHGGDSLTYDELEARANRLAAGLRASGVQPDDPVGVMLPRSLDMIVAVLGVLKAGGAYMPLDPSYPRERLRRMIEDARCDLVVGRGARLSDLTVAVLDLDVEHTAPATALARSGGDEQLAYVLFTSGSTGKPKGVAMPHRTLANLIAWQLEIGTAPPGARTLQFAPLGFDVSFQEMFSTLAAGGTLVLVDEATRRDPAELLRFIARERIERIFVPFVILDQLAAASAREGTAPSHLREIFTAGEALVVTPAIRTFFSRIPGCRLHNHYGPTESHVVTAFTLPSDPAEWPGRPSIGRPIANARIEILDRDRQRVPAGIPGEIAIGGGVLARGYLNHADLTAERFVPDPFSVDARARLYLTGDRGRFRADGMIDYLGRSDDQVKIKGYRVEVAEIEVVLRSLEGIAAAAVIAVGESTDTRRLVAYVVPSEPGASADAIRTAVAALLPDYMVPSTVVLVDGLPISANGKVDRRALPAPDVSVQETEPARSESERALAALWQEILGLSRPPGRRDDFFALGGHSLLAVRMFSRIEQELGVRMPLSVLFGDATVAGLAAAVEREQQVSDPWRQVVPLRGSGTRQPLYLVHSLHAELLTYRGLVRYLHPDQPVFGLQAVGLDRGRYPHTRIETMAAAHIRSLRGAQPHGPYLLGGYCFAGVVAYEMARQLAEQGEETRLLALFDSSPFGHTPRPRGYVPFPPMQDRGLRGWALDALRWCERRGRERARWIVFGALVALHLPMPKRLWNVEVANRRAVWLYKTPPSPCRMTLFRRASSRRSYFDGGLWSTLARGGVEVWPIQAPGDRWVGHGDFMREPNVLALAAALNVRLDELAAE